LGNPVGAGVARSTGGRLPAKRAVQAYSDGVRGSVTVYVEAPPETVWALVSDITNTGEFSPETFEAEWLDGVSGPAVGARFRGHVRRNGRWPVYWTNCTVTACEPGREFDFQVDWAGRRPVNTWRYQFEPRNGGTDVTESFELADLPMLRLYWRLAGKARGRTNRNGMRTTLERIKAKAEGRPTPAPPT
jgi:uncharacterized protein YndB with AHSA1/START domain